MKPKQVTLDSMWGSKKREDKGKQKYLDQYQKIHMNLGQQLKSGSVPFKVKQEPGTAPLVMDLKRIKTEPGAQINAELCRETSQSKCGMRVQSFEQFCKQGTTRRLNNQRSYHKMFSDIATMLTKYTLLKVENGSKSTGQQTVREYFQITEVELFVKDSIDHNDTFTPEGEQYKQAGTWQFRDCVTISNKKIPRGLDIAIGGAVGDQTYGAVLIKSVRRVNKSPAVSNTISSFMKSEADIDNALSQSKIKQDGDKCSFEDQITGKHKVVSKILELAGVESISSLLTHKDYSKSVFAQSSLLSLVDINSVDSSIRQLMTEQENVKLWACPRAGLNLRQYDYFNEQYWMSDYRFVICPQEFKHCKEKNLLIFAMLEQQVPIATVSSLNKYSESIVKKHKQYLDEGVKSTKTNMQEFHKKSLKDLKVVDYGRAYALHKKLGRL